MFISHLRTFLLIRGIHYHFPSFLLPWFSCINIYGCRASNPGSGTSENDRMRPGTICKVLTMRERTLCNVAKVATPLSIRVYNSQLVRQHVQFRNLQLIVTKEILWKTIPVTRSNSSVNSFLNEEISICMFCTPKWKATFFWRKNVFYCSSNREICPWITANFDFDNISQCKDLVSRSQCFYQTLNINAKIIKRNLANEKHWHEGWEQATYSCLLNELYIYKCNKSDSIKNQPTKLPQNVIINLKKITAEENEVWLCVENSLDATSVHWNPMAMASPQTTSMIYAGNCPTSIAPRTRSTSIWIFHMSATSNKNHIRWTFN